MKKIFYIILVSLALLSISCRIETTTYKDRNNVEEIFNGKVKSYQENVYNAVCKFGEAVKHSVEHTTEVYFNEKGYCTNQIRYDKQGVLNYKRLYTYDNSYNLLSVYEYNTEDKLSSKFIYEYDERDFMKSSSRYDINSVLICRATYEYDVNDNVKSSYKYNGDGSLNVEIKYKYDPEAINIEEEIFYNPDGTMKYKRKYKYDYYNNIAELSEFDSNGKLNNKYVAKYDDSNNKVEDCNYFYQKDDIILCYKYKYDFDVHGNCLSKQTFNKYNQLESTFEYEYDKKRNWIKRTEYKSAIPVSIIERHFEYY